MRLNLSTSCTESEIISHLTSKVKERIIEYSTASHYEGEHLNDSLFDSNEQLIRITDALSDAKLKLESQPEALIQPNREEKSNSSGTFFVSN